MLSVKQLAEYVYNQPTKIVVEKVEISKISTKRSIAMFQLDLIEKGFKEHAEIYIIFEGVAIFKKLFQRFC